MKDWQYNITLKRGTANIRITDKLQADSVVDVWTTVMGLLGGMEYDSIISVYLWQPGSEASDF